MAQIEELLLDNYVDEDLALINNNFSTLNTDKAEQSALNAHEADNDNPHKVTKDQVGLGNVPNIDTSEAIENSHTHTNKTILDNIEVALTEQEKLRYQTGYEHTLRSDNPHNVTKTQVGLSNVDNTSDASKPLSIATINALATKLDITTYNSGIALKANLTDVLTKTNTGVYIPTLDYHPATKKYVDDVVISTNNVWKRISGTIYPYVNNDNVNIGTGSMTANKFIINGAVENDSDAATKKYVDDQLSGENLWDRNSEDSTLCPHHANDNIDLGSGNITTTGVISHTLTLGAMTAGSLLFAGTGGTISQDNTNLFWDNTNKRLGIGTTTAVNSLDIASGYLGLDYGYGIKVKDSDGTYQTAFYAGSTGTTVRAIASTGISFETSAGSRIAVITNTGQLLVGATSAVSATDKLEITDGNVLFTNSSAPEYLLVRGYNIGTSVVSNSHQGATITLSNLSGVAGSYADIRFQDAGGNGVAGIAGVFMDDATNEGDIAFIARPAGGSLTEWMRLKGNGYFGIGTTSPNSRLHITGGNITLGALSSETSNPLIYLYGADGTGANARSSELQVDTARNLTIGSWNGIGLYTNVANGGTPSTGTLGIYQNASGNVGIGTSSPSQQLEITRNIKLPNTTSAGTYGVIYKGGSPFIHNFNYGNNGTVTTDGHNTFVGINSGNFTMGSTATQTYNSSYNTGVGYYTLRANTTGRQNTALGFESLFNNTTGYQNTALGYASLFNNTTGYSNVALGYQSLFNNTTGYNNTALGLNALFNNTTGYYNTALGMYSGRYISDGTTGNQTSSNSTYLGYNTKALADGDTNETVIGYNATGAGSNTTVIGNSSVTNTYFGGSTGASKLWASALNLNGLTASKVVFTDASKNLTSTGIGTSSQFIKGDGSLDSSTYLTTSNKVTDLSGDTSNKDKYLHSNASTGALEWTTVSGGGGITLQQAVFASQVFN